MGSSYTDTENASLVTYWELRMEPSDLTSTSVTLPAPDNVMAYTVEGRLVVRRLWSINGDAYDTTTAHEVQSLLLPNSPKITFIWTWSNPFGGEKFTTKYRVMSITRSIYTTENQGSPPEIPGSSQPEGMVFVQGVKIDQSNGPQVTPWLRLNAGLAKSNDLASELAWE